MPHFSSVHFQALRGLRDVTLEGCADVNLLIGGNNSGKTTVLEGLALLCRPDDLAWWIETIRPREFKGAKIPEREVIKRLFPNEGTEREELFTGALKLDANVVDLNQRRLDARVREERLATRDLDVYRIEGSRKLPPLEFDGPRTSVAAELDILVQAGDLAASATHHQFSEDGALPYGAGSPGLRIPCQFVTTVAHRTENVADQVGAALLNDRRESLAALLSRFQGTETTFETVPKLGQSTQIWLREAKTGWLPLSVTGDGLRRAFHFGVAAVGAAGGVLLIDEIESALHVSALRKVYGFLVRECRALGVQLFATTHSLEAVDAIVEESAEARESLVAFVLKPDGPARRVEGARLKTMREEYGFDIR